MSVFELAKLLDHLFIETTSHDRQIEAAISNFETAFKMQTAVPELYDISDESAETLVLYGINSGNATMANYGKQCLLARNG